MKKYNSIKAYNKGFKKGLKERKIKEYNESYEQGRQDSLSNKNAHRFR